MNTNSKYKINSGTGNRAIIVIIKTPFCLFTQHRDNAQTSEDKG